MYERERIEQSRFPSSNPLQDAIDNLIRMQADGKEPVIMMTIGMTHEPKFTCSRDFHGSEPGSGEGWESGHMNAIGAFMIDKPYFAADWGPEEGHHMFSETIKHAGITAFMLSWERLNLADKHEMVAALLTMIKRGELDCESRKESWGDED